MKLITSNKTGGLYGLQHYIPIINFNKIWYYNDLTNYIIYNLYNLYNIDIPISLLQSYINMTNFNYSPMNDANYGLTEYEYNSDTWINIDLK